MNNNLKRLVFVAVVLGGLLATHPAFAENEAATMYVGCTLDLGIKAAQNFGQDNTSPEYKTYVSNGLAYCGKWGQFTAQVVTNPTGKVATQPAIANGTALEVDPSKIEDTEPQQ